MQNPVIDVLRNHRSIRKFSPQTLSDDLLDQLVLAGQAASSSSFVQAYSIIDICDPEIRQQLQRCCSNQAYVGEAARFLVFCADFHRLQLAAEFQGIDPELGFTEQFLAASIDAALVAQNIIVAAESVGLGGVYIGAIRNKPKQVTEILALPEQVFALFGMCLGYPDQNPEIKPRLPAQVVLHRDVYNATQYTRELDNYDRVTAQYYTQRTQGAVTTGWSQQMAEKLGKESRPDLLEHLQSQGLAKR